MIHTIEKHLIHPQIFSLKHLSPHFSVKNQLNLNSTMNHPFYHLDKSANQEAPYLDIPIRLAQQLSLSNKQRASKWKNISCGK